jgi:peptidoglycan/LPS O-acetylase OafA/YrhL
MSGQAIDLRGRFVFLDGLRGLAAVAVMFFHFFNHWVSPIHDSLAAMLPRSAQVALEHADLGVEVFFVLSGFVIAHTLFDKTVTPRFAGNFIVRRSLRLDPPYWAVLAATLALPYVLYRGQSPHVLEDIGGTTGVLVNLFYLPDVLWKPRVVGVAWTLCLEVQFYLAFLLVLAMGRWAVSVFGRRSGWIEGAIFVALLSYSVHRWFSLGRNDFGGRWFMFFSGVLLYWSMARRLDRRLFAAYLIAMLMLSIGNCEIRSGAVVTTAAVIYAVTLAGGLRSWLGGKTIQYFGRISYSLYLVHMTAGVTVIQLVMRLAPASNALVFVSLAAAVGASILLADVLNRCVEMPAARLGKRINSGNEAGATPKAAVLELGFPLPFVMGLPRVA